MLRLFSLSLVALAAAQAPNLEARATSNDKFCSVVKAAVTVLKQQAPATAYCSSYLNIGVVTSTSTISTTTTNTITTTSTATEYSTTVTSTSTITQDSCPRPAAKLLKERGNTPKPKPSCLSTYTASTLLSSACSCLSIPSSTTTTTTTTTLPATATAEAKETVTTASTTTKTVYAVPTPQACSSEAYSGGVEYKNFFAGCGVTQGDRTSPAGRVNFRTTYPGSDDVCTASQKCADECISRPQEYSYNLLKRASTGLWHCTLYLGSNNDPSYYNVKDADILESYGYNTFTTAQYD